MPTKVAPKKPVRRKPKVAEPEAILAVEPEVAAAMLGPEQPPEPAPEVAKVADKAHKAAHPGIVADIYLKTTSGVLMIAGADGDAIREYIEQDKEHSPLEYRFFDDDRKRWAYWAVRDDAGVIRPPAFPDPAAYSLTPLVLYTKAVTYVHIFAHAAGLLRAKPPTMWDRMLKPTTVIMAIVGIVFIMGLMLMALTG